jgi:hypothetical protein
MKAAVAVLDRSLDKGNYAKFVQWDTFQKARSVVTNISQAGAAGLGDAVGAYEKGRMWILKVPTHSFWFNRFMTGIHKRVGEIKRQDEPVTIDVLHKIDELLEMEWNRTEDPILRGKTAEMGAWIVGGFCTGLRGEEMLLIEYAGTAKSVDNVTSENEPYFTFVISGRTKGNQLSGAKFGVPCVGTTEGTHLRPGKWVKRLVESKKAAGVRGGRLFTRKLLPAKLFEFENDFFTLLERVQAQTTLIAKDMDVRDAYGIMRSLRQGLTSHAKNMGIPEEDLKGFNCWRSEIKSGGAGRLDMPALYAALKSLTPALLQFTRSL